MNFKVVVALVGSASFAVGAGLGYILAEKSFYEKLDEAVEKEVRATKEFYEAQLPAKESPLVPDDADIRGDIVPFRQTDKSQEVTDEEVERRIRNHKMRYDQISIGEEPTPPDDAPKVQIEYISDEDFVENESGYSQQWWTYFEVDGVFIEDSLQMVIEDVEYILGTTMLPWGELSESNDVVHVRNHILEAEYEISREQGAFSDLIGPGELV